jgi:hypothetical protein
MARIHGVAALMMGMCVAGAAAQQPGGSAPATRPAPSAAQPTKPAQPGAKPGTTQPGKDAHGMGDMQLPPGLTMEDLKACEEAAKPGPNHEFLAKSIGTWDGATKMWMAPNTEPTAGKCTAVISPVMEGKFTRCEVTGDTPMGPFNGFGIYGYDNVGKTFQSTWISNCGTGMSQGKGELASDGKTITWTYDYNCPIAKGPIKMREIHRWTGPDSMVLEMYSPDKSGKEFKTMEITCTRKAGGETNLGGARSDAAEKPKR